jgi:hypothetical protein
MEIWIMTVNDPPPAVTTDPPEPEFGKDVARLAAAALVAKGHTAEDVREYAADRPAAGYMWRPIAAAMDALLGEECAR